MRSLIFPLLFILPGVLLEESSTLVSTTSEATTKPKPPCHDLRIVDRGYLFFSEIIRCVNESRLGGKIQLFEQEDLDKILKNKNELINLDLYIHSPNVHNISVMNLTVVDNLEIYLLKTDVNNMVFLLPATEVRFKFFRIVKNYKLSLLDLGQFSDYTISDSLDIRDNPLFCDYMDIVDRYAGPVTELTIENNCIDCQVNDRQKDFSKIEKCEKIVVGNLTFETKVAPMDRPFQVPRIDGCFFIENTDLRTLSFLKGTRTKKGCKNTITGNPYLCDFMDVVNNFPNNSGTIIFEKNCHLCSTHGHQQKDFQLLSRCEDMILGDVVFKGEVAPLPRWIHLERIEGCFEIIDTDLTTVSFLIGTRTRRDCVNVIRNNKKACDVQRVLDNIPQGTYIVAEGNCEKICTKFDETSTKNCEVLYTDSAIPLDYIKAKPSIKKVFGPVKIVRLKTATFDPKTLPDVEFDHLVFRNSEFLCDEEAVRKLIAKHIKVTFKHNCWKRCTYPQIVYNKNCFVFEGILDHRLFNDIELFQRVVQKLEGIEGQIKIVGSVARNLIFRNLTYVKNDRFKGPAILIKNNKYLTKLVLKKLQNVTSKEDPKIYIKDNGDFKFRASVGKRLRNRTQTVLHKSLIIDIHKSNTKAPEKCSADESFFKVVPKNGFLYYFVLLILVFLSIATAIVISMVCRLCVQVETGDI